MVDIPVHERLELLSNFHLHDSCSRCSCSDWTWNRMPSLSTSCLYMLTKCRPPDGTYEQCRLLPTQYLHYWHQIVLDFDVMVVVPHELGVTRRGDVDPFHDVVAWMMTVEVLSVESVGIDTDCVVVVVVVDVAVVAAVVFGDVVISLESPRHQASMPCVSDLLDI